MKKLGLLSILAAAILLITVWYATRNGKAPYSVQEVGSVMKGVEVVYYEEERPQWRAEIGEALFVQDETGSEIRDVSIYYYRADVSLRSDEGFYDISDGRLRLDGTVEGRGEGFVFASPELLYLPSEDALVASKGLVIEGDRYVITGRKGRIGNSQVMEVNGDVRAVFY